MSNVVYNSTNYLHLPIVPSHLYTVYSTVQYRVMDLEEAWIFRSNENMGSDDGLEGAGTLMFRVVASIHKII